MRAKLRGRSVQGVFEGQLISQQGVAETGLAGCLTFRNSFPKRCFTFFKAAVQAEPPPPPRQLFVTDNGLCVHLGASYLFHSTGNLPTPFGHQLLESLHIAITQGYLKCKYVKSCEFDIELCDQIASAQKVGSVRVKVIIMLSLDLCYRTLLISVSNS